MSMSRDEMLADFQACTGIDEVDVAIAQLEQANWSLQIAVNAALATPGDVAAAAAPGGGNQAANNPGGNIHRIRIVNFDIRFEERTIQLSVPDDETILDLKERIHRETQVKVDDQDLSGFRSAGGPIYHVNNTQKLSSLNLIETNALRMRKNVPAPAPITPQLDSTMPYDPEEKKDFVLSVVVLKDDGSEEKSFELNYRPATTVLKVKKDLVDLTEIPVRHQKWVGWPESRFPDHELTLMKSGMPRSHKLILSRLVDTDTIKAMEASKATAQTKAGGEKKQTEKLI